MFQNHHLPIEVNGMDFGVNILYNQLAIYAGKYHTKENKQDRKEKGLGGCDGAKEK